MRVDHPARRPENHAASGRYSSWARFPLVAVFLLVFLPAAGFCAGEASPSPTATTSPAPTPDPDALTVLFLGDSMSLCGFGSHFDKRLREDPQFAKGLYTYVACGTIPASWLKRKPFLDAKTACGFLTIKTKADDPKPDRVEDAYGMTKGHKPDSHPIPKLEDLLEEHKPDVLVIQTGDNLFDIFRDKKTVAPDRHASELEAQLKPFIDALKAPSSLRRVYWVSPPISGRVSDEIQEFVFQHVSTVAGPKATIIDSRPFFTYPYKHMEPDHEHFIGPQMDEWADKVYDFVKKDIADHPLPPAGALAEATASSTPAGPEKPAAKELSLSATLVSKSKPLEIKQLLPYQESLVAYVYEIRDVSKGEYKEKEILVMHPAHIGLKPQPLDKYKEGEIYTLHLREIAGTQWETIKSSDESGRIDLVPYIRVEDDARFPQGKPK